MCPYWFRIVNWLAQCITSWTNVTFGAERAVVRSLSAVTQVAVVLLHTLPSVAAVHPITGAVALATWLDARRDLSPFLEIKGDAVHAQASDAAQEAPLAPGSTWAEREVSVYPREAEAGR